MMNKKPMEKESANISLPEEKGSSEIRNEQKVPVDGFRQVLEMLRIADPSFRDSLLKRLAARDRELARSLKAELGI